MKEYNFGNSIIVIHSKLTEMTLEQQKEWYQSEWENKNPVLKGIVEAAASCQQDEEK